MGIASPNGSSSGDFHDALEVFGNYPSRVYESLGDFKDFLGGMGTIRTEDALVTSGCPSDTGGNYSGTRCTSHTSSHYIDSGKASVEQVFNFITNVGRNYTTCNCDTNVENVTCYCDSRCGCNSRCGCDCDGRCSCYNRCGCDCATRCSCYWRCGCDCVGRCSCYNRCGCDCVGRCECYSRFVVCKNKTSYCSCNCRTLGAYACTCNCRTGCTGHTGSCTCNCRTLCSAVSSSCSCDCRTACIGVSNTCYCDNRCTCNVVKEFT